MSDPSLIKNTQAEQHVSNASDELLVTRPWLSNYEEGVAAHLDIPDRPLTWLLDNTARHYPNNIAIIYYGHKITYAQLSTLANRFAIGLQKIGVKKGDRVAIALPNIPQYPIAFYGALRAGAVVVPTNPLYTERELSHQLNDSGATVIVMLDTFYPSVRNIRAETKLEHIIVTSPADFLPPLLRTLYPLSQRRVKVPEPKLSEKELRSDPTLHTVQSFLKAHKGNVVAFNLPVSLTGDDLAALQYTGGTTGLAKGAMLTHRNILANAMQTRYWTPKARMGEEISLCVAPFFHAYGLTVGMNLSILAAASMVLLPRFKSKDVLKAIQRYKPTLFPGIPTMYIAIMREAGDHHAQLQSIKYCISGAAPLAAKVQEDFEKMTGATLVEGYGLSEASPVTHCNPLTEKRRNGSIGLPLPNVEAIIVDPLTGEQMPVGEVGEILVKGPNIMKGYWKREDETKAIFHNGWMRTGDVGRMDEEGYFYVVERAKDIIIAGGFNVYPREVEEVLFQHPDIAEAAVVGAPDEYRGETVAAFVVLKPDVGPSEETRKAIIAFCKQELASYKVPKVLEFRESLPKSIIGKTLRRELRITKS
ncbi:MAG: long-chain fatty acid--CoA ligase [Ktedonobacteraceae bacterium]|nr:long-chain fatty acid--CoA ligase [Ktedonobacteraceae bacterium]